MVLQRPSLRWRSLETWRYGGMDIRLEAFLNSINKSALVEHARTITGDDSIAMSDPFSAGQYWCCFELFSSRTDQLFIARVRLPPHPQASGTLDEATELYSIQCEVATMQFLQAEVKHVRSPRLFAFEPPGSEWAARVGASYLLIEGFYGNTLQDVEPNICNLSIDKQQHIITQWTRVQAELAAFTFPQIGSLCQYLNGSVTIGTLATAEADSFTQGGPFEDVHEYFTALADAKISQFRQADDEPATVAALTFKDIVQSTSLFQPEDRREPFHLNHMDMGTQNILVDDDFNFLAIIDWEFAQTAPWEVNHYPMPFPLLDSDDRIESILTDPEHVAYDNVVKQVKARQLYSEGFAKAEEQLAARGRPLLRSISKTIHSPAARIVSAMEKVGVFAGMEEELTNEMIRLAFGFEDEEAAVYIQKIRSDFRL